MRRLIIYTLVLGSGLFSETLASSDIDSAYVKPFGKVYIYKQVAIPPNVVIMISGDAGWKSGVPAFSSSFADMYTLVIGVDIMQYYKELRQLNDSCFNVAEDFIRLATGIEKKYNYENYLPPVIFGYSSGATLIYGILAQAHSGAFIGGISLGFCPEIDLPRELCQTNGLREKNDITGKSYVLEPDANLAAPWIVLQGKSDKVCNYSQVADFVRQTRNAELITLPNVGHGFSKWSDFMPQWKDAYSRLIEKHKNYQTAAVKTGLMNNFPVVITNSKSFRKEAPIALIISGDGGWYHFEQSIADYLADYGIPTIGLDARKYFWNRKSPEETTIDITRMLTLYSQEWGKNRYIIIGYSLGAEIVPFIENRLPGELKSNIASTVLLSPGISTDFEIHISNMLGIGNHHNTYNVVDEISKTRSIPTLMIFGEGEDTKIPELLSGTGVRVKKIPGDHHYKSNSRLIVETMRSNHVF